MKITEIYNDVINENVDYEFKAELNPENPMKWAKTIVGYARSQFLTEVINPLLADGIVIREGNVKSPKSVIKLSAERKE